MNIVHIRRRILIGLISVIATATIAATGYGDNEICIPLPTVAGAQSNNRTIDLRGASSNAMAARLLNAGPKDLVIVDPDVQNDASSMSILAASKNVKFCVVATRSLAATETILSTAVGTPQIVAVLPTDAPNIRNVFGDKNENANAYVKAEAYMKKNVARYSHLEHSSILDAPGSQSFSDHLFAHIQSNSTNLLVLVGHSENGYLKGPDGSRVSLQHINDECGKYSRPAIILSCSTIEGSQGMVNGIVTPRPIEFDEIAEALGHVQSKLNGNGNETLQDFMSDLSVALVSSERRRHTTLIVKMSFVGTLVIAVVIYELDRKHGNRSHSL